MKNVDETNIEPRKVWVAPELKKIDIEQITAAGTLTTFDAAGFSS